MGTYKSVQQTSSGNLRKTETIVTVKCQGLKLEP